MNKTVTCAICGKKFSIFGIAHHIKTHEISFKQYYDNYLRKDNEGYCKICNKPTEFINLKYGYKKYCCRACIYKDKDIKNKRQQTNIKKYNTKHYTNREKAFETTKKNGMYRTKLEDRYLDRLKKVYPDIIQHYTSEKYPFKCDFYIPSKDLYIELNVFYLHGGHFFDEKNPEDLDKLNDWKSRNIDTTVWTVKDIIKRNFAIRNKLKYLVLWSEEELVNFIENDTYTLVDTNIKISDLQLDHNNKNQCQICGMIHHNISGHVRNYHKMSSRVYYDKYLKKPNEDICPVCGKPNNYINFNIGYNKHCSTKCSSLDPKVQEKFKATNFKKYGVENPYQSEEIKERIKQDRLAKFGVEHPLKRKEIAEKVGIKSAQTKYKIKDDFISEHPELITKEQLTEKYGWMWYWDNVIEPVKMLQGGRYTNYYYISDIPKIETYIEETIHKNRSHKEMELLRFVQSIYSGTIKHDCKSVISPKEIDIYLPDLQLGIEYNGTRWHSIEMGTPKDYHLDKSLLCRSKGIHLIHIYEFEDFEEQKQLLKDLINGQDNYPKNDFNKNNLLNTIPKSEIIYKDNNYTIYGAGKLVQNNLLSIDTLVEVKD